MMRYMIMNGPFKKSVIETEATLEELNSKPDIQITFVAGPFYGLVSRSLICYDRKLVRAVPMFKDPIKLDVSIRYVHKGGYYGSSYNQR